MGDAVTADTAEPRGRFDAVPLVATMAARSRDELWAVARVRTTDRRGVIVTQGSATDYALFLLSGEAASRVSMPNGREVAIADWEAPAVIDKVTTLTRSRHEATIVATTDAMWCSVPASRFRAALSANPVAQEHALGVLASAAGKARTSFVEVVTLSSVARLARWLIDNAERSVVNLPRPQERLAHRLGMTRVTLNRSLHELARLGLVEVVEADRIVVLDPIGLRTVVDH